MVARMETPRNPARVTARIGFWNKTFLNSVRSSGRTQYVNSESRNSRQMYITAYMLNMYRKAATSAGDRDRRLPIEKLYIEIPERANAPTNTVRSISPVDSPIQ